MAPRVDGLFFFLVAVSLFFLVLIALLLFFFLVKYRRRSEDESAHQLPGLLALELLWTFVPLAIAVVIFVWGAVLFVEMARPPRGALEIFVVGKQWMWKIQHPKGNREINEMHVPVGVPVKLTMTSEDVIHSMYIPAFRVKADVVPGRYTSLWFEATKVGAYHLFCAEYCGTDHSRMRGQVVVTEPIHYQDWLTGSGGRTLAEMGEQLFQRYACHTCHAPGAQPRGPLLTGRFGQTVVLQDGRQVAFDEDYVRESILAPATKVVAGYEPVMPTFQGQLDEEALIQIIAYLKSLTPAIQGEEQP